MTSTSSAADTGLPEIPTIPTWLDLGLYLAMSLTVGTAWLGVLMICWGGVS